MSRKPDPRQIDLFAPAAMVQPLPLEKAILAATPTDAREARRAASWERLAKQERPRHPAQEGDLALSWNSRGTDTDPIDLAWTRYDSRPGERIWRTIDPFDQMGINQLDDPEAVRAIIDAKPEFSESKGWETLIFQPNSPVTPEIIEAAYSADTLTEKKGRVRVPFAFRGSLWVNTGGMFCGECREFDCYRIVEPGAFAGPGEAKPYHDREFFHADRELFGGYHGMLASSAGKPVVIVGPPIRFMTQAAADRYASL